MHLQKDFRARTIFFKIIWYWTLRSAIICALEKNYADDTCMHNGKKFKTSKEETILGVIMGKELTFIAI